VALSVELGSGWLGRGLIDLPHLEGPAASQHAPGDAGELVGEGDCQHVVMQPFPGHLEPGLEPVALFSLISTTPRRLHEQNSQVAIATPG
jgi:hypothetical protein